MRLVAYGGVSTLSASCAVLSAFRQRANFYAAAVYLSKSNACMMVLCNFGIFCTIILAKIIQSIFFGKLRLAEIERINDRLWFTISETLLALAMFRDEFDTSFVVLFVSLIFVKCFHWLAALRVEWMDQSATPPGRLFHARMISILSLIWMTDMLLIAYATESVLLNGPSVLLMFEMEYIIMQVTCLSIICKYILNSYAHYRAEEHWEAKSTYQFYIDLATDFLKLLTYIGFLSLTLTFHGLPINVLRDVYYTFKSFISKCNNLIRFRQATRNMNERYPNATREEMEQLVDKTCIICREDMEYREGHVDQHDGAAQMNNNDNSRGSAGPNDTPKKLGCGHIFHFHCLRSWLERQQTCPTCRRPVIQSQAATPAAPPNPQAAVNRALAALAAAGAPPLPPAPQGIGRAAAPAAQPAQPQQPIGGDGMAAARADFQQRLREFQQRMASVAANANGTPNNPAVPGPSSHTFQSPFRPPPGSQASATNPLSTFDLSDLSSSRSSRSFPELMTRSNNPHPLGPSGLASSHTLPASLNQKNPPTSEQHESSQRPAGMLQIMELDKPVTTSHIAGSEASDLKETQPSTLPTSSQNTVGTQAETENPLQNLSASSVTPKLQQQTLTAGISPQFPSSQESQSHLISGEIDSLTVQGLSGSGPINLQKQAFTQLPCLIPLFDTGRTPAQSSSTSSSLLPGFSSNHQSLLSRYRQQLEEVGKFKINTGEGNVGARDNSIAESGQHFDPHAVQQLIEIQNSLLDCCSKLASFLNSDQQVAQILKRASHLDHINISHLSGVGSHQDNKDSESGRKDDSHEDDVKGKQKNED